MEVVTFDLVFKEEWEFSKAWRDIPDGEGRICRGMEALDTFGDRQASLTKVFTCGRRQAYGVG